MSASFSYSWRQNRLTVGSYSEIAIPDTIIASKPNFSGRIPGGHFKFLHLWPGQIPPWRRQERVDCYSEWVSLARRLAASLRR